MSKPYQLIVFLKVLKPFHSDTPSLDTAAFGKWFVESIRGHSINEDSLQITHCFPIVSPVYNKKPEGGT